MFCLRLQSLKTDSRWGFGYRAPGRCRIPAGGKKVMEDHIHETNVTAPHQQDFNGVSTKSFAHCLTV
eukprot:scaffold631020_cov51-Attheya_sp.AAC.1